jgi:hypothetical protein
MWLTPCTIQLADEKSTICVTDSAPSIADQHQGIAVPTMSLTIGLSKVTYRLDQPRAKGNTGRCTCHDELIDARGREELDGHQVHRLCTPRPQGSLSIDLQYLQVISPSSSATTAIRLADARQVVSTASMKSSRLRSESVSKAG